MSDSGDSGNGVPAAEPEGIRPNPDVIARRVDAGTVLSHLRTNQIYELNATGSRIWELLGSGCTVAGIRGHLQEEFEVGEAEADEAIREMLDLFRREGLIDSAGPR